VLWDSPVDTLVCCILVNKPVVLRRELPGVPSSVADNVFWLGRYVERAESTARIVRCMASRVRRANEAELACLIRLPQLPGIAAKQIAKDKKQAAHVARA